LSWLAYDTDGWIDLAAAKAKGAEGVGLYLGFNLLTAQAQTAAQLGLGLWSFWEAASSNPNGGASQGTVDATVACNLADQVGQPSAAPIFMPNDQVVSDETATLAYFRAAADQIRKVNRTPGFYGQASVWQLVKGFGYDYFVKAPDGTNDTSEANIVQRVLPQTTVGGVTVDVDEILTADYGGWNSKGLYRIATHDPPTKGDEVLIAKAAGTQGPWYLISGDRLAKYALSPVQLNAYAAPLNKGGFGATEQPNAQQNWLDSIPTVA
jgi:hypothetical protein